MTFSIYINSHTSFPALAGKSWEGLADDLHDFLGEAGRVKGVGATLGSPGWIIHLELVRDDRWVDWILPIGQFLVDREVPRDTELAVRPPGWVPGMETLRFPLFPPADQPNNGEPNLYP